MSVPTPSGLPPKASNADSPPEEPPDVNFRFSGFNVRPKTLFTDSAIIIAVGTFVLQYRTAPSFSSSSTRVALYGAGWSTKDVKPTVLSFPTILKLSLSEIGRPWRGPTSLPVLRRCSSSDCAILMASRGKKSERQFVWGNCQHCPPRTTHELYQLLRRRSALAKCPRHLFGRP
jgi:hypothetical protein